MFVLGNIDKYVDLQGFANFSIYIDNVLLKKNTTLSVLLVCKLLPKAMGFKCRSTFLCEGRSISLCPDTSLNFNLKILLYILCNIHK